MPHPWGRSTGSQSQNQSGGYVAMHSANLWRSLSSRYASWIRVGSAALLISSALLGLDLAAQSPAHSDRAEQPAATPASPAPNYTPNYALEARFLPANLNKLVFDLSVTPHWFTLSDKFWYTYRTSSGANYYVVDPLRKSRSPLWDNAKVAAALSLLTNFPYRSEERRVGKECSVGWWTDD